ncbi:MAG: dinuclear metal center YbgI/SA1388 family protein [Chlamydiales bacterium]|jgi:dinuclear metal center YbgI/SA1388 family protein
MTTLQALSNYLEELLDSSSFKDYCPNGLQVEGRVEIKKIATGVSASLRTIEAAVSWGADALIVHHGMFWKGDNFSITGSKQKKLSALLKNEISLLSYHLPLDAHRNFGNNWKAAMDLEWDDLEPFGIFDGAAIGVKGTFDPIPVEEFRTKIEEYYKQPASVALGGSDLVCSAALVSGGAYRCLADAAKEQVDCFITGNFDEPAWHIAHEESINFFAQGHFATERVGPRALGEHLSRKFGLSCEFIDEPNPF